MSKAQELAFEIMKMSSFNNFDGEKVVNDLSKNQSLWRGAYMTRMNSLVMLRDMENDYGFNIDTLYILPSIGKEDELQELAKKWDADYTEWIGGEDACNLLGSWSAEGRSNKKQILKIWWD